MDLASRNRVEDMINKASYECISFPRKEKREDEDPQCDGCGGGETPVVPEPCTTTEWVEG